ncbi:MAG: hypothetical protein BGO49_12300 [Planctomycetales bacterium 71-10]|nr:MAG: hypothetical protein BGO49_12300 [Planctomycetales bacterium 71-10]
MYFLLSGEGATDLGIGLNPDGISQGDQFLPGPLALVLAAIIEHHQGYSPADTGHWGWVPESMLANHGEKGFRFVGKKRDQETTEFYRNARALARIAREKLREPGTEDEIVVVLFHDTDGSRSARRGNWTSKRRSMLDGFAEEGLATGVPMIPKPKSEAWILCALHHHQHGCDPLESRSGNDRSPNSLKGELESRLAATGRSPTREDLCEMVHDGGIDWRRIRMPSFDAFYFRLREAIGADQPGDDLGSRR